MSQRDDVQASTADRLVAVLATLLRNTRAGRRAPVSRLAAQLVVGAAWMPVIRRWLNRRV